MKVVILNNDFRVYWRGRLMYLQHFLASRNITVNAVELFGKGSPYLFDTSNNTETWWTCLFPCNSSNELSKKEIKIRLFNALDDIQPDIIIGCSIVFYAGALGLRWAKENSKKFIMFDDVRPAQLKRNRITQLVKNTLIKQADGLWFPSPHYQKDYAYFYRQGIHFFYGFNCIDNQQFTPPYRRALNTNKIVCVARLVPIKNLDNLLKAWQAVEQQHTGYELVIIGSGSEKEKLYKLQNSLQLSTVKFLGAVDNKDLSDHYHQADAFILPSLSESWGLVVNEAMAAGLPVLLSAHINAGKALLNEGTNGFSFTPLQVNSISEAILKYIRLNAEQKKAMSEHSINLISEMSYESMGIQLLEGLKVINKQKQRPANLLAAALLRLWYGRYNTAVWDKLT